MFTINSPFEIDGPINELFKTLADGMMGQYPSVTTSIKSN